MNTVEYVIDPSVADRGFYSRGDAGFATETGGDIFVGSVLDRAVDQIWSEAGHYYVLGYEAPSGRRSGAHRIEVKVTRKGVDVHARQTRRDEQLDTPEA